jgi:hypothetical protein
MTSFESTLRITSICLTLCALYTYFSNGSVIYVGSYYVPLILICSLVVAAFSNTYNQLSTPDKLLLFLMIYIESLIVLISNCNLSSSYALYIALEVNIAYAIYSLRKNIIIFQHECKNLY